MLTPCEGLKKLNNREIIELLKKGEHDTVIRHMIPLVHKIARQYRPPTDPLYCDLVQEGCIGLMRACKDHDFTKKGVFTGYAVIWAKNKILNCLRSDQIIRIPEKLWSQVSKIRRATTEQGVEPTQKEVMALAKCGADRAIVILETSKYSYLEDKSYLSLAKEPDEVSTRLLAIKKLLTQGLGFLNEQEKVIIFRRYGFNGAVPETLHAISRAIDKTDWCVRAAHMRALYKIKRNLEPC